MKVLDLFCGAGGASMGLHHAWPEAEIWGIDIVYQKRYPFNFACGDAITFAIADAAVDFIWASPPCERFSQRTPLKYRDNHLDYITPIREKLLKSGKPFVIENVPSARNMLIDPIMLCGSMFGLDIRRHRYFEIHGFDRPKTPRCKHQPNPVLVTGATDRGYDTHENTVLQVKEAMRINWMIREELDKAIPPVYSEFIAKSLKIP